MQTQSHPPVLQATPRRKPAATTPPSPARRTHVGRTSKVGFNDLQMLDTYRATVRSRSEPEKNRDVEVGPVRTFCDCKGFEIRGRCYHTDTLTEIFKRAGRDLLDILDAIDAAQDPTECRLLDLALRCKLQRSRIRHGEATYQVMLGMVAAHRAEKDADLPDFDAPFAPREEMIPQVVDASDEFDPDPPAVAVAAPVPVASVVWSDKVTVVDLSLMAWRERMAVLGEWFPVDGFRGAA